MQEHTESGRSTDTAEAFGQPRESGAASARSELQPAKQSQDGRRCGPSRPRRAIPSHQRAGEAGLGDGDAGDIGGHQEERTAGNYDNGGQQWLPAKKPIKVNGHDFPSPDVPRAYPYGIYDLGRNTGFVNVGTDHDTGAFAVASIRGWWRSEGRRLYAQARTLLITADGGGSNGARLRLWKLELQKFADETGLSISVCHFPPGTSKWNKIEHRLFSFI